MVQAAFLLESSFIALTAIVVGTALGLLLAWNIVDDQRRQPSWENLELYVPWLNLLIIFVVVYAVALLATLLPAVRASATSRTGLARPRLPRAALGTCRGRRWVRADAPSTRSDRGKEPEPSGSTTRRATASSRPRTGRRTYSSITPTSPAVASSRWPRVRRSSLAKGRNEANVIQAGASVGKEETEGEILPADRPSTTPRDAHGQERRYRIASSR
jgi:hypothetical protein